MNNINAIVEMVKEYEKDYDIVPISKEIYADVITPITLLRRIASKYNKYYLLESVESGEKWGRYSFIGYNPKMRLSCKKKHIVVEKEGEREEYDVDDAFDVIRNVLKDMKSPRIEGLPTFTGGFVGYFAYSSICHAEPKLKIKDSEFNDFDLMLFDKVIAYDMLRQKLILIANAKTKGDINANVKTALDSLEDMKNMIKENVNIQEEAPYKDVDFKCNVTCDEYCDIVEKTKEYIKDGDIFQAVISRRFESDYKGSLINPYRVLRTTNPSPYMVYMNLDDVEIMSTSPETLVSLENGRLTTFPVAGSRPRGKDEEEDNKLTEELLADEKELSEHNMLVDLGRNDLGRISKFGSVEVTKYMMIHKYSKIMHICSQVEGNIEDGYDALDAIKSVLPAGTLSGAPKFRACEIIDEMESEPRGIYGGALGYIDFGGNMDTCIAIRMAVKKNDKVYVQAGGGIVADSVPINEYEESKNKAMAVMNAIKNSEIE